MRRLTEKVNFDVSGSGPSNPLLGEEAGERKNKDGLTEKKAQTQRDAGRGEQRPGRTKDER